MHRHDVGNESPSGNAEFCSPSTGNQSALAMHGSNASNPRRQDAAAQKLRRGLVRTEGGYGALASAHGAMDAQRDSHRAPPPRCPSEGMQPVAWRVHSAKTGGGGGEAGASSRRSQDEGLTTAAPSTLARLPSVRLKVRTALATDIGTGPWNRSPVSLARGGALREGGLQMRPRTER